MACCCGRGPKRRFWPGQEANWNKKWDFGGFRYHGDEVSKPLVSQFVPHHQSHPLTGRGAGIFGVDEQSSLPAGERKTQLSRVRTRPGEKNHNPKEVKLPKQAKKLRKKNPKKPTPNLFRCSHEILRVSSTAPGMLWSRNYFMACKKWEK